MSLAWPKQPMPDFVKQVLADNNLLQAYDARPPYQRNDYLSWINRAVRKETKQKRLNVMLAELKQGNGYMNMKWKSQETSITRQK